jgi:hypothetical protein
LGLQIPGLGGADCKAAPARDLLFKVISSVINEPEINEEIKLKIFEAISNHEIKHYIWD